MNLKNFWARMSLQLVRALLTCIVERKFEQKLVTDGERKFVLGVTTISDLNVSIRIDRTETYPGDLIIVEDIRKEARYLEAVHNNVCGESN